MIKNRCKTNAKLWAHLEGLGTKLLLTTFDMSMMSVEKNVKTPQIRFLICKKNVKKRIVEHWLCTNVKPERNRFGPKQSLIEQIGIVLTSWNRQKEYCYLTDLRTPFTLWNRTVMLSYPVIYLQCGCIWQRLIRSTSTSTSVVPILQSDIGTCRLDVFEEVRLPSTSFLEAVLERTDGSRINNFLRYAIPSVYNPSLLAGDSKAVPNRPYFRSGPEHQRVRPGALFVPRYRRVKREDAA